MGTEIERKYLIHKELITLPVLNKLEHGAPIRKIAQGYLSTDPERTVRVRMVKHWHRMGDFATNTMFSYITIKGKPTGCSCPEFEYTIPEEDAKELFKMCSDKIFKTRYAFECEGLTLSRKWEVDVFHGDNEGLIVAELEVYEEKDYKDVIIPDWIATEVTGDPKYYNSSLVKNPYKNWSK